MSWRILVKAALAALFVVVGASLVAAGLLQVGVPVRVVRTLAVVTGIVAAAVIGGATARRSLAGEADLIRARAHGVLAAGAVGLFVGLLGTLQAVVAVTLAAIAALLGWLGARYATAARTADRRGGPPL